MKKKIIILQPYLAPYRVGLFNELCKYKDIDLSLIYFSKYERRRKWEFSLNKIFNEYDLNSLIFPVSFEKNFVIPNLMRLVKLLYYIRPNVVICSPNIEGSICLFLSKILKFQIICWLESTIVTEESASWPKKIIRTTYHKNMSTYIIPGINSLEYLKSNNYFNNGNGIYFASNTVEEHFFSISRKHLVNKFKNLDPIKIIFSGSSIKRKGLDILLEAFKKMKNEKTTYYYTVEILGTGNEIEVTTQQNVSHIGFLSGNEYRDKFINSHIFVLPSRSDCSPLTMIEAVKSGNIILASDAVGNAPEIIKNNGYIFKRNSVDDLLRHLKLILNTDKDKLFELANNSVNIAKNITNKNSAKVFYNAIFKY